MACDVGFPCLMTVKFLFKINIFLFYVKPKNKLDKTYLRFVVSEPERYRKPIVAKVTPGVTVLKVAGESSDSGDHG